MYVSVVYLQVWQRAEGRRCPPLLPSAYSLDTRSLPEPEIHLLARLATSKSQQSYCLILLDD